MENNYLKWNDLEFGFEAKFIKVKLNDNIYILKYLIHSLINFQIVYIEFSNREIGIVEYNKQFFNDLHFVKL